MNIRAIGLSLMVACLPMYAGCGGGIGAPGGGSAAIVGRIVPGGAAGKLIDAAQQGCPDVVVTLNNLVVDVELDDDCVFLIDNVRPAARAILVVELSDLGVAGTIELTDVRQGELIEILVEADDESMTISVLRRAAPDFVDDLPVLVAGNNVTLFVPAGTYNQTLTVEGNNFTLVGEAGANCSSAGWSVITGDVIIEGNNATFRNIRFEGAVEVAGNNAHFINSCLGSDLVIFGNNIEFDDDENGDDDDDDGGDDDDDDDRGDDDDDGDDDD